MDYTSGFRVKFKDAEGVEMPDIRGVKIPALPNIGDIMCFPRWIPEVKYIVESVEHEILEEEGPNDIFIVLRKV